MFYNILGYAIEERGIIKGGLVKVTSYGVTLTNKKRGTLM
jgi:hypothetical protein